MRVELRSGNKIVDPVGKGTIAEFIPHVNSITGKPDPYIQYAPGFFLCMSTAVAKGYTVYNAETQEVVVVDNLSPN